MRPRGWAEPWRRKVTLTPSPTSRNHWTRYWKNDSDEKPVAFPAKLAGDEGYRADGIDDYLISKEIIWPALDSDGTASHRPLR